MAQLPAKVGEEIEKIVVSEGLELVNVELKTAGRGLLLRIDIDKQGGVTVEDCSLVAQQLSAFLDVEDPIPGHYELQVSSPGLDRRFYKVSDYEKFLGRLVRVQTTSPVRGLHVIIGHLQSFDGKTIVVNDPNSKKQPEYEVALENVKEARLEIEF